MNVAVLSEQISYADIIETAELIGLELPANAWTCWRWDGKGKPPIHSPTRTFTAVVEQFSIEAGGWQGVALQLSATPILFNGADPAALIPYRMSAAAVRARLVESRKPDSSPDIASAESEAGSASLGTMLNWLRQRKCLRYNAFSDSPEIGGRPLRDADIILLRESAEQDGIKCGQARMQECVTAVLSEHHYDPLAEYMDSVQWDGIPRLAAFLADSLGCKQSYFNEEIGTRFLVGAVDRALNPGCQHRAMLILISRENVGKSKFFKTLCPNPSWFTDYLPRDLHSQQASESVMGKFIIESAELASFGKSAIEAIKAFISREVENFRPAYGHYKIAYHRRCVLVGSTNNAAALQRGEEWTRAWPVHVREYNHTYLLASRDQIWAEAVTLYRGGYAWWDLPDRLVAELEQARSDCTESDSWEEILSRITGVPTDTGFQTCIAECQAALEIPVERRNRANETRIGIIMTDLGWTRKRFTVDGKRVWRLFRRG